TGLPVSGLAAQIVGLFADDSVAHRAHASEPTLRHHVLPLHERPGAIAPWRDRRARGSHRGHWRDPVGATGIRPMLTESVNPARSRCAPEPERELAQYAMELDRQWRHGLTR